MAAALVPRLGLVFVLLGMTVIFLPDSPPLKVSYKLDTNFVGVDAMQSQRDERATATLTQSMRSKTQPIQML